MATQTQYQQLLERANRTEALLSALRAQTALLRTATSAEGKRDALQQENRRLKEQVQALKYTLCDWEVRNGKAQFFHPAIPFVAPGLSEPVVEPLKKQQQEESKGPDSKKSQADSKKSQADSNANGETPPAEPPGSKNKKGGGGAATQEAPLDVRRLDMRVGRILECARHPDADTLYVERVDVGEGGEPRTIVSGLVRHVPLDEMVGRRAVFLLNLKPAKMRGVLSQGMIMCASSPEGRVEILRVPETAAPGDPVSVEGFPREPDSLLNPKKKIFETLKPELRVDATGRACFRGAAWRVTTAADGGVHPVTAPSLTDAQIS